MRCITPQPLPIAIIHCYGETSNIYQSWLINPSSPGFNRNRKSLTYVPIDQCRCDLTVTQICINHCLFTHRVRNFKQMQSGRIIEKFRLQSEHRCDLHLLTPAYNRIGSAISIAIATFCCDVPLPLRSPITIGEGSHLIKL